jgi:8-oxo-dGTP diphosphatase
VRDLLLRQAYRVGYRVMRLWWRIARPVKEGVKCVLTRDGEILLVRHTYADRRRWELPGGGIKRREQPLDAARRETREELGIDVRDWTPLGDLFERAHGKHDHLWCFAAELDGRPLELDRAEIAEARWFSEEDLPPRTARHVARIAAMRG